MIVVNPCITEQDKNRKVDVEVSLLFDDVIECDKNEADNKQDDVEHADSSFCPGFEINLKIKLLLYFSKNICFQKTRLCMDLW